MFKGLAGIKKVVKGGFNVVAETSSQLADQVVNDPNNTKDNLKESIKKKVQGGVATVVEARESASSRSEAKEKAGKVVHDIKHYGAFSEEVLGYSDPTKELRKAVKQKEKAAKKARKEKKKKTGKTEDLFDPENLAKYKKELEEKRKAAAEVEDNKDKTLTSPFEDVEEEIKFDKSPASETKSPFRSKLNTPKEEKEDWQLFKSLTSGVDSIIQQKKTQLEELKLDSYFQRKPTSVELQEEVLSENTKKKKKVWVDLENEEFEDYDGVISAEEEEVNVVKKETENTVVDTKKEETVEKDENDIGLIEIQDDDPFDPDEEIDLFNTDFVEALAEVKLAVIPDSPTYDDEDDPFNTAIADEIIRKDKLEKKRLETKLKFEGLGSVAEVLSGKAESVDKSIIEHTVRRKRRRANRINLIAETESEVTAIEDIGVIEPEKENKNDGAILIDEVPSESLSPGIASVLATTPTPKQEKETNKSDVESGVDISEFENIVDDEQQQQLTSNVAILAGEFATAKEESEDEFDAAFDALAQESVTKTKIEELEKNFENDEDLFDTSAADKVLGLASLTNKVPEDQEKENLANFDDPFDTSAYEEITSELVEELEFESLAQRKPEVVITPSELQIVPKKSTKKNKDDDPFGVKVTKNCEEWTAFKEPPKRPPPPKRAPPRPPSSPVFKTVKLDPSNRPSVVVKAPSNDSLKSWNCSVAESLIRKSEIEAQEAAEILREEEDEDEFDPFDTTDFDLSDQKVPDNEHSDPFDTSNIGDLEPGEAELKALEAEEKLDKTSTLEPQSEEEKDPFDTDFASNVLPDKGDPFDTSYVEGGPGKAEIRALEEEFLEIKRKEDNSDGEDEANLFPNIKVADSKIENTLVKEDIIHEEENTEDPFDTSIVDKVIPVRAVKTTSILSVEDEEFDPTETFKATKKRIEEELDPFDTSIAGEVIPELKSPDPPPKPTTEPQLSIDSDDFNPRA